jgi:hypothetical protein
MVTSGSRLNWLKIVAQDGSKARPPSISPECPTSPVPPATPGSLRSPKRSPNSLSASHNSVFRSPPGGSSLPPSPRRSDSMRQSPRLAFPRQDLPALTRHLMEESSLALVRPPSSPPSPMPPPLKRQAGVSQQQPRRPPAQLDPIPERPESSVQRRLAGSLRQFS